VAPTSVRTPQIYWGAVPFLLIQLLMVGILIAVPDMVSMSLAQPKASEDIQIELPLMEGEDREFPPSVTPPIDREPATPVTK
jgi:hypothetical protein